MIIPLRSPQQLDSNLPTYFYGAAKLGQILLTAMGTQRPHNFAGFVDSHRSGTALGFPIYDLGSFALRLRPDDQIVITSTFVDEITQTLSGLGVRRAYDANIWNNTLADIKAVAKLNAGVPLRRGIPYEGPEAQALITAQAQCGRLEFSAAAVTLTAARSRYPQSTAVLAMLAYIRWAQNQHTEARDLCDEILELEPNNRTALNRLGRMFFQEHRYEEVAQTALRLVTIDPDDGDAVFNFCVAMLRSESSPTWDATLALLQARISSEQQAKVDYFLRLRAYLAETKQLSRELDPRLTLPSGDQQRFVLSLSAFGEQYVSDLLTFMLPSLIAEGNVETWARLTNSMLVIATNTSQVERITTSPSYRVLSTVMKCEVIALSDDLLFGKGAFKYQTFSATLLHAVRIAKANHAGLLFLAPDFVFSTNFFKLLWDVVESGKDVIFYAMQRLDKAAFYALGEIDDFRDGPHLSIPSQDLSRIALPRLPPFWEREEYHDGGIMNELPGKLTWRLDHGGVVTRGYLQHPLLLTADAIAACSDTFFGANDSDFLNFIGDWNPDFGRCALISSGDVAIAFDLTNTSGEVVRIPTIPPVCDHFKIAAYGVGFSAVHRWLFSQLVVYKAAANESCGQAVRESNAVVADVLGHIERMHALYGTRSFATGYVPYNNLGFPELAVEV